MASRFIAEMSANELIMALSHRDDSARMRLRLQKLQESFS
jgi:hypothetical protein